MRRKRKTIAGKQPEELRISGGPNGLTAVLFESLPAGKDSPVEPMASRVSLHPFLAGMNRPHFALLTDCAMAASFKKGATILAQDEFADHFYLVETGHVILEATAGQAGAMIIDTIGAGSLLGRSWMFPPHVWRFTARAAAPTNTIIFLGAVLREYCEKDHSFGYELFKRMSAVMVKCLQAARDKMLSVHVGTVSLAETMPLEGMVVDSW